MSSYEIRRLDPDTDEPLYRTMYTWLASAPRWRREAEAAFGPTDWDSYYSGARWDHRLDIGIFAESELIACITLTLVAKDTYEAHLAASRTADPAIIIAAGHDIRDWMFGPYGARYAFTWTPVRHHSVDRINKALGFMPDNVSMFKGVSHGRPIEWRLYSFRSTDGRQQNQTAANAATAV